MVTVIRVSNLFEGSETIWDAEIGYPLKKYLPDDFDCDKGFIELDGKEVKRIDTISIDKDATLVLVDSYASEIVAWVVLGIIAAASLAITIASAVGAFDAALAIEDDESETDYLTYTGIQTTVGPGRPIPFVLGEMRVGGHIIESYSSPQYDVLPSSYGDSQTITRTERIMPSARALNTLIALCWGPVESISDIEIDDNPVENIPGIQYEVKYGTNIERAPEEFEGSRTEVDISSGVISVAGGAYVWQTQIAVDSIAIKIEFTTGLYDYNSGELQSRDVQIKFEYKLASAGSYTEYGTFTASGAARASLEWWVLFPQLDRDIYDIRVTRITADNTDPEIQDEFEWDSSIQIVNGEYAHPGIAKIGFRQVPQERQSVPRKYTAVVKGSNDVRIYTDTDTYTKEWTDNPVWLALYWITHPILGLGKFYSYDDVEDIYEWIYAASWCDEMVEDGRGGYRKRATFNHEFKSSISAFDLLKMFQIACGLFIVEEGGKWRIIVDDDDQVVQNFSEGNYVKDSCVYSWLNTDERATQISGRFANEERDYEEDIVSLQDQTITAGEHSIEKAFRVDGATHTSQVARQLQIVLNKSRLSNRSVTLRVGEAGRYIRAGDIFGLSTLTGSIGIGNGRILRILPGYQCLFLDAELDLSTGTTYELSVCHQSRNISTMTFTVNSNQTTSVLDLAGQAKWVENPIPGEVYSVGEVSYSVEKFRCMSTGLNQDMTRTLEGIKHDPDVYNVEFNIKDNPATGPYFNIDQTPGVVVNLSAIQRPSPSQDADVSWRVGDDDDSVHHFDIWYKVSTTTCWLFVASTVYTVYTLKDLMASTTYDIAVIACSARDRKLYLDDATATQLTTRT